jgi:hypothetical protein
VEWLPGAERIRGELLKLGIVISKRTIQKYLKQRPRSRSSGQTWSTFVSDHAADVWATVGTAHFADNGHCAWEARFFNPDHESRVLMPQEAIHAADFGHGILSSEQCLGEGFNCIRIENDGKNQF